MKMIERRKHKRYKLNKEAFVRHSDNFGTILDFSIGGMLCECTVNKNLSPDSDAFGICYGDEQCLMEKIKVRRITEKVKTVQGSDLPVLVRKCGIQFDGLDKKQRAHLKKIITKYKM